MKWVSVLIASLAVMIVIAIIIVFRLKKKIDRIDGAGPVCTPGDDGENDIARVGDEEE